MSDLLVYGAYGYSGKPITEAAVAKGLRPIVAGRDRTQSDALAEAHGLESRSFPLDDPAGLAAGLRGVKAVLHCAGPFSATSRPMLDACVRQGVHYLDITGEFRVMEAVAARDGELRAAGVMAMCGTGMDVVPTDCLAAHMKRRMPDAQRLDLYVRALEKLSPGTALTMLEGAGLPNVVREGGRLLEKRAGAARRKVAFPSGRVTMVGMPWGDICSAWYTTGIPNIAVHMSLMPGAAAAIALGGCFRGLLQAPSVQRRLKAAVRRHVRGPTPGERDAARCEFVAEATDRAGNLRRTYLVTREGYAFTIDSAVEIADRVLKGAAKPGYQTPAGLFGPDFVLEFAGSQRQDLA